MEQDSGGTFEQHAFRTTRRLRISQSAPSQEPPTTHPDPGGRADPRLWTLRRQAHGRRSRRGVRDRVQGGARHARRRRAGARPGPVALAARCRSRRSATTGGAGTFTVDRPGRWRFAVAAWSDRIATWQDELRRKSEAGQQELAGELSEGAVLLGGPVAVGREGLAAEAGDRHDEVVSAALLRRCRPGARAVRRLVRAVPAFVGRLPRASTECFPNSRGSASTSSTCRRSTRSGSRTAKDGTTRVGAEPDDVGSALGDRLRRRRSRSDQSRARHVGGFRRDGRGCARGWASSSLSTSRSSARRITRG